jgi:hypothetical protein
MTLFSSVVLLLLEGSILAFVAIIMAILKLLPNRPSLLNAFMFHVGFFYNFLTLGSNRPGFSEPQIRNQAEAIRSFPIWKDNYISKLMPVGRYTRYFARFHSLK